MTLDTPTLIGAPITLNTAEMVFLLTILNAPHLIGGDNEALFPADEATKQTLWEAGKQQLEASGRIVWDAEEHTYHFGNQLVSMLIDLAFPEVAFICQVETANSAQQVTFAIGTTQVIELTLHGQEYRLRSISSVDVAVQMVANTLALPPTQPKDTGSSFTLDTETLISARQAPDILLQPSEQNPLIAHFAHTLGHLTHSVTLTLFQIDQGQIQTMRTFGLFIEQPQDAWLIEPTDQETATAFNIILTDNDHFIKYLQAQLHALHQQNS
jgi:hypothetical protein